MRTLKAFTRGAIQFKPTGEPYYLESGFGRLRLYQDWFADIKTTTGRELKQFAVVANTSRGGVVSVFSCKYPRTYMAYGHEDRREK